MNHHLLAFALLACWFVALRLRQAITGTRLEVDRAVSPIQALQPAVQLTILCYWALYWTDLRTHAWWIALHIVFCFGLDAAWAWTLGRRWRLTLGPIPVVFSTNLFLYYDPQFMILGYALYAVAFGAKALLRREDRKHIFNPSAFGMAVMILGGYAWWWPNPHEVDHAFLLAPNIIEVLFLISPIGQLRIPIIFTTLGAYAMLEGNLLGAGSQVSTFYPSTFIAILLLVTDPRTSPRTPVGQLLFGMTYALSYQLIAAPSEAWFGHDGSAKVLAVLPANLMVPWAEAAGRWAHARLGRVFEPPLYRVWVAAWVITIVGTWAGQPARKASLFALWVPDHERNGTPWVVANDEGRVTCEANPVFCKPFSFVSEARMWLHGEPPSPVVAAADGPPP